MGIGSSEVVNGGRGRCEKSPRKKCARDETRRPVGASKRGEERQGGFGGGEEFTNDGKSSETTRAAFFFKTTTLYVSITFYFCVRSANHGRRGATQEFHGDVCERAGNERASERASLRLRADLLGAEETTRTFFRILAIFYATSHALYGLRK